MTRVGLFVDGGTQTGVAVMTYESKPRLLYRDTIRLGKWPTYGVRLHKLDGELQEVVDRWRHKRGLCHVGFEAPYVPTGPSAPSARFPICCAGKIEEVADRNSLSCSEVVTSTLKSIVAGHGRADKVAVRSAISARGYTFGGEHEADAIGVGLVCINNWLLGR